MKNVSLVETQREGKLSWRLIGPNGQPIPAFDAFAISLRRDPFNTRRAYCRHLAEFIDYLFEAASHLVGKGLLQSPSNRSLVAVLEAYDDYLVLGEQSGNSIAKAVASTRPSRRVSKSSSSTMHAPLRRFLRMSELIRGNIQDLTDAGLDLGAAASSPLPLAGLTLSREPSRLQREALFANSMIAGVISGGPKLLREAILPTHVPDEDLSVDRAFPLERAQELIKGFDSSRDRAIYSLSAASGGRISEVLQLLWSDVNVRERTVRFFDPATRPNEPSYSFLDSLERDRLVWKGRDTSATLLIEPFASSFFEHLERYLKKEYVPHSQHHFVFQYGRGKWRGLPFFLSKATSRLQAFHRVAQRVVSDMDVESFGVHSLRHMYGVYLVNYFPCADGSYGLPMPIVQKIMGHKSIRHTKRYARLDAEMIRAQLEYANSVVRSIPNSVGLLDLRRRVLQRQLSQVIAEIEANTGRHLLD